MNNATLEIINYSKDLDYEYNMKIMILTIISLYSLIALWYFKRNECKYYVLYLIKRLNQVFCFAWFFFLPIYVGTLYRTVSFEFFYLPMVTLYGLIIVISPFLFMFGYGEKLLIWFWGFFGKSEWVRFRRLIK